MKCPLRGARRDGRLELPLEPCNVASFTVWERGRRLERNGLRSARRRPWACVTVRRGGGRATLRLRCAPCVRTTRHEEEYGSKVFWILAALFFVLALAVPSLRVVGIVGLTILALLLGWAMLQRMQDQERNAGPAGPERGSPVTPARTRVAIPTEEVLLRDLALTGSGAPFELSGRVVNGADDAAIKSVTLQVTRRDCYEGALDPSGCVVVWRGQQWISVTIPPGEERAFRQDVWAPPLPRARGTVRDEFQLLSVAGEPASP